MTHRSAGFSLLEVLLAMTMLAVGLLSVAPLFVASMHDGKVGGEFGLIGAIGLERMEFLRTQSYESLIVGGSVDEDSSGYFDNSVPKYVVRWSIEDNPSPPNSKIIRVYAATVRQSDRPQTDVLLTTLRSR